MPNWPLSTRLQQYLINHTTELSARKRQYAHADFPLTTSQIQYAIMDEEKVDTLRRYVNEGVKTIERHRQIRIALLRDVNLRELNRSAVIQVSLPEWIVVDRATHYGLNTTKFKPDEAHYLVPDFSNIDAHTRHELALWTHRAVRQTRMHHLIYRTVQAIVNDHCKTVAHLRQAWPILCTYMNSDPEALNARGYGDRVFYEQWRDRFRAPVRPMRMYDPSPEVIIKYGKVIKAADSVLTGAMLLAAYNPDRNVVNAEVEHWEELDGDFKL